MNMLTELTDEQYELLERVQMEWENRTFCYDKEKYCKDCIQLVEQLCKLNNVEKPYIIFLESPAAALYVSSFIQSIYFNGYYYSLNTFAFSEDEPTILWNKLEHNNTMINVDNMSIEMKQSVMKIALNSLSGTKWDREFFVYNPNVFRRKNMGLFYFDSICNEFLNKKVNHYLYEKFNQMFLFDDFMTNSLNSYNNEDSFTEKCVTGNYRFYIILDFLSRIGLYNDETFIKAKKLLLNGVYDMYWCGQFCFVSALPVSISRNEKGVLNNLKRAAIEFGDGYKVYAINGRQLPSWIWEKADNGELTKEIFLKEKSVEIRAAIYTVLGDKKIIEMLNAKEIDKQKIVHQNGDIEDVTLLKTKRKYAMIGNEPFAWIKMTCPSTGSEYLIGVEPFHTNALEAIASLSPFKTEEYSYNYRT